MTNNEHAKELEAQEMMYPEGDVFDALMAGAAALRGVEGAKAAVEVALRERHEAIVWKAEYMRQVFEKDEQCAEAHALLFKAEADRDDARAEAAALGGANRWRPIAEVPPPNRVELWWPYWATSVQNGFLRENGRWCSSCVECDDPDLPGPTHWRPLSDPPEGA